MFKRSILKELENWANQKGRKPLVLRGARQVGKTTVVDQFAQQFDQYIYLNLELNEDKELFTNFGTIEKLIQSVFFLKNKVNTPLKKTLLFIDEIQQEPKALNTLRYFYEKAPELYVIAAGSLLETLFNKNVSFPVGRVEYKIVRPVSFPEFLDAMGEHAAKEQLLQVPLNDFAKNKLLSLFHTYTLIGGMPEVINKYCLNNDLTLLSQTYESLIVSYMEDVEKYASSSALVQVIRHAIKASFSEAGKRITLHGFGKSTYRAREMGEALRTLEKALLIHLVYPQTSAIMPLLPDHNKSPRLHVLDTGMMNYFAGIQKDIIGSNDLSNVYNGSVIEHIVGQELLACKFNALSSLNFWTREKKTSNAEVDYLYAFEGNLIPIEVKSGAEGKLKSLHMYMDQTPHSIAIRFYAGDLLISKLKTPANKEFYLLSLPYFLVSQTEDYIKWLLTQIKL